METQKGPYTDYSPFKGGLIWVSMLVWGSVGSCGRFKAPGLQVYGSGPQRFEPASHSLGGWRSAGVWQRSAGLGSKVSSSSIVV